MMFGGVTSPAVAVAETQALRVGSISFPSDACIDVDTDGDGLRGCQDPDCWGRCTPGCPPDRSCASTSPRCGDGACSSIEDRRLCPADCP
jgi:hypothetical protein